MSAADAAVAPGADAPGTGYGTIVVVGGGCYGAYYVRQLGRARLAGRIAYERLVVVDRDPACRVALDAGGEAAGASAELVVEEWTPFFARYLAGAAAAPAAAARDAVVPSPLMPHLLYEWLLARARERWPHRAAGTVPLDSVPPTPWERAAPDGTHYVSFAEWMCPVNCVEPARCPATRGPRSWSMPPALAEYAAAERRAGRPVEGPLVFHCTHRAYGVGMIDVAAAVAADASVAAAGAAGAARVLVATVSHCHGAVNLLALGPPGA
jgi:hypothetical protein